MIESAEIHNFRSLRDVELSGLRRVNLVVGDNGAGKTALLEALYVASTEDQGTAVAILDRLRGLSPFMPGFSPSDGTASWASLFYREQLESPIQIMLRGPSLGEAQTEVRPLSQLVTAGPSDGDAIAGDAPRTAKARVTRNVRGNGRQTNPDGTVTLRPTAEAALHSIFHPSTDLPSATGNARQFSALARVGEEEKFTSAFREQFPEVEALMVLAEIGPPQLYARLSDQRRPQPLHLLSAGMTRVAAYLLAIATTPGGTVLLDEVESGLYFKRYPLLWRQLHHFAQVYDTQVFASSHSHECNEAAVATMLDHPDDFALVRIGRVGEDTRVRVVPGRDAADLIASGLEYR